MLYAYTLIIGVYCCSKQVPPAHSLVGISSNIFLNQKSETMAKKSSTTLKSLIFLKNQKKLLKDFQQKLISKVAKLEQVYQ